MKSFLAFVGLIAVFVVTYVLVGAWFWDGVSDQSFRQAQVIAFLVILVEAVLIGLLIPIRWL